MEERAREEVCQAKPIQDKPTESIEGELNIVAKVTPSTTPIEKGNGKGAPQSKAKPPILVQEAKNAKPQVKYIDEYFVRKAKTLSFWLARFLNLRKRNPLPRVNRGVGSVVPAPRNPLGLTKPRGKEPLTGRLGKNGKNNCVSLYFLFSVYPLP